MKEKGEHHHLISLDDEDLDLHLWVLPKEFRNQVRLGEAQVRTGDEARAFVGCANFSYLSIDMGFAMRVSDPFANLTGPSVDGRMSVPCPEKGQDFGVNWRFSGLEATVPNARAEVICEWSPKNGHRGRRRETMVKFTTAP